MKVSLPELFVIQTVTLTCHDPIAAGPWTTTTRCPQGVRDYAAVTYEALHSYLIEGLRYSYELFPPSQEGGWADLDEADAPAEDAREDAVVRAATIPPPATFNMVFWWAAASAAPPASAAPAAEAGAAPDAVRPRMHVRPERLPPNRDE